jgi:hypothetical protein
LESDGITLRSFARTPQEPTDDRPT